MCIRDRCYTVIKGAEFREVSLVYHAGFPVATIEAYEKLLKKKAMESMKGEPNINPEKANEDLNEDGGFNTDQDYYDPVGVRYSERVSDWLDEIVDSKAFDGTLESLKANGKKAGFNETDKQWNDLWNDWKAEQGTESKKDEYGFTISGNKARCNTCQWIYDKDDDEEWKGLAEHEQDHKTHGSDFVRMVGESKIRSREGLSKEELEQEISKLQNYLEHAITQEIPVMPKMRKMQSLI